MTIVDHKRRWFGGAAAPADLIKAGAVFRNKLPGNAQEVAEVLEVGEDAMGVKHVRFKVEVEQRRLAKYQEFRTLGLDAFAQRYPETIAESISDRLP